MHTTHRAGFTLVEGLVALAVIGVAAGLLASAVTVATAARRRAALDAHAAATLRTRVTMLARRSCADADTAATDRLGGAVVVWTARREGAGWAFVDSLFMPGTTSPPPLRGTVRCL
jgi:prepilin-type N-terminal cleavage/methylation domain-containing protein